MSTQIEAMKLALEPTKAMIDAAERIDWSDADVRGNIVNMWQAMCAAAPPAPAQEPLTYVDLRRIANRCGLGANEVSARTQATVDTFARAIEAAHNITKGPK